jgi:nucleotide-binding universal stress UspA family protein
MAGIVVGYDGTAGAKAALAEALDLGKRLGESLTVVFGFDANPVGGEALDYWEAVRQHGESVLASALEEAKAAGVEVESLVAEKAPSEALSEIADERDAAMIVVGSHGERPIRAVILGSTPHRLLHLSSRPVLVVRAAT